MSETRPIFSERTSQVYQPLLNLAEGGMGTVDVAARVDGPFSRLYAIKRLLPAYRNEARFREMFIDEARVAGLLRHPNVVGVLDVGEDLFGPYLVMDYVEGISASQLIGHVVSVGASLPLQLALRIAMEAAEGLHAAHELVDERGRPLELIHRDVSPQNLLLGFDGITRVADFGIAKALGRLTKTDTGLLKGKFGYMSPEQLRFQEPDRRSDLFSLGVVLFELCSGARLYQNQEGMDGVRRLLEDPPPDLGEFRDDVPPALTELLFAMLAKEPSCRPATALSVARSLERILAEEIEVDAGRVEAGEYLEAWFGAERQRRSEAIAMRLRRPRGEGFDDVVTAATRIGRVARKGHFKRWPLWGVLVALLTVCSVALASWRPWVAESSVSTSKAPRESAEVQPEVFSEDADAPPEPEVEPPVEEPTRRSPRSGARPAKQRGVRTWGWQ